MDDSPELLDPESPEVTPLDPPSPTQQRSAGGSANLRRRLGQLAVDRRMRLVMTGIICVALLSLLLVQVIPGARQRVSTLLGNSSPTYVVQSGESITLQITPEITPVVTPLLGPSLAPVPPVTGPLPPPPTNCPTSPQLDSITAQPGGFQSPVQLYGRSPIWVPAGYGHPPGGALSVGQPGVYDPYPGTLVIWEIGPMQYPRFTAQVSDVANGAPAYWHSDDDSSVVSTLTITPYPPDVATPFEPTYFGWPMGLIFTRSGCYKLDVTWSGGGWYTIFAVGGPAA